MQKIVPLLWFGTQAEEAANFYTSVFKNSKITNVSRYGKDGPGAEGLAMMVTFDLEKEPFMALNGGDGPSPYSSSPAFFINCETQEEIDWLWEKLAEGGKTDRCGWLRDKYNIAWNIVPTILAELMTGKDPKKSQAVFQAMLTMDKLEIDGLQKAYDQA